MTTALRLDALALPALPPEAAVKRWFLAFGQGGVPLAPAAENRDAALCVAGSARSRCLWRSGRKGTTEQRWQQAKDSVCQAGVNSTGRDLVMDQAAKAGMVSWVKDCFGLASSSAKGSTVM